MQNLVLIGSGGCMREILWQIEELNKKYYVWLKRNRISREKLVESVTAKKKLIGSGMVREKMAVNNIARKDLDRNAIVWNVLGYVDVKPQDDKGAFDIFAGNTCCPYLGDDDYLLSIQRETNVVISVGEPKLRKRIAEKLMKNPNLKFPNLIMGDTRVCPDIKIGQGCIISMGSRVSTNVTFGDFVFLNMGTMVCHDGEIGDFSTLGPEVKLAGQVDVGKECELGLGTKVIQGIHIGNRVVTGAGSVVIKDVGDDCTVVGVPAKPLKYSS